MTGFGQGLGSVGSVQISAEIKSVNHRFLDIVIRSPREYNVFENDIRLLIKEYRIRGRVEVFINRRQDPSTSEELVINENLAVSFFRQVQALANKLDQKNSFSIDTILAQQGMVKIQEPKIDLDLEMTATLRAVEAALKNQAKMLVAEGRAMKKDLLQRLKIVGDHRNTIARMAPELNRQIYDRLKAKVVEYSKDIPANEDRLAQELAFQATRSDITEELVRLKSHLSQMKSALSSKESIGRKLDFLLQETNREVTTIGSKVGSSEVSNLIVEVKSELEKLREQAQNIE